MCKNKMPTLLLFKSFNKKSCFVFVNNSPSLHLPFKDTLNGLLLGVTPTSSYIRLFIIDSISLFTVSFR